MKGRRSKAEDNDDGKSASGEGSPKKESKLPPKRAKASEKSAPSASKERVKVVLIPLTIVIGVLVSWAYNTYLAGLVNKPLNEPKVVNESLYKSPENLDRYWGTYRSNLYFGLKTRSKNPLMAGMMWFNQFNPKLQIRHWCDQNDGLLKYGWIAHDGRNFGVHDIYESVENSFSIRSSWVKRTGGRDGGDWSVRTRLNSFSNDQNPAFVSVIFYFSNENVGWIKSVQKTAASSVLAGETDDVGKFKVKLEIAQLEGMDAKRPFFDYTMGNVSVAYLKETLVQKGYFTMVNAKSDSPLKQYIGLSREKRSSSDESNFIAYQVSGFLPLEFEVIFESQSLRDELKEKKLPEPVELKGAEFDSILAELHGKFTEKFESIFKLKEKQNLTSSAVIMAHAAFSNLIGGIGFFTGQPIVKSLNNKEPVLYWPSSLYTAVPSRSFFPRGFLWDEGFHNVLISLWDKEITKDIIAHWLDLMNTEGWIPREVILGEEARAKVPSEFVVQNNQFANPPTLFIPLYKLVHEVNNSIARGEHDNKARDPNFIYLTNIYNRLRHWYDWFNNTQIGSRPYTYRWRGRVGDSKSELNPKTLTSGLDDYPRASHPTDQERHLDLRCWMAWASKVMADLFDIVANDRQSIDNPYRVHYEMLKDNKLLDELHWSNSQYADYGLHSDRVKLVRQKPMDERTPPNSMPMIRQVDVEPAYQYVNSVGYVSLFPMLLELLDPQSAKLDSLLDQIRDPKHLWTNFGLRSLSKSAPLYDKRNTEHDPPYWRSPIWININYLALKSLKYYSQQDGPYKQKADKIYQELRANLIKNMVSNYETSGYIWEQYNDVTGRGQGSHPFTGWSSLIVLIMSEVY